MITPFDPDLRIDWGAYRQMVAWYLEKQVGGLYANCLSSEMYALSVEERLLLTREAVRTAGGRVPVASTGNLGSSVDEHIHYCRQVAECGADVVMLVVPEFCENDGDLERYFFTLAEKVSTPLGIYECPAPRFYHLGVELARRLALSGRFVAYKETSCDLVKIKALLAALQGTPLALLQANTPYLVEAVRAGAPGSMTIAAIWLPELVAEVIEKTRLSVLAKTSGEAHTSALPQARADDSLLEHLHAKLCALKLAQRAVHPLGTKYLLSKRGLPIAARGRGKPSLPPDTLLALDYAARQWFDERGELR
jgi:4-hydroxy-tetrahydrodipicolinate synthase